ncbi:hypothetical protein BST85_11100 [Aureitalea marina]|uniref:Uncharacterized protein n=2 Tax=Aureitalea marina TaxID=930804 RepID=A0A2S7KS38_9FLAO|nr:hypothetical protein BST85_11100 [Aureitalea marina]
MVLALLSCLLCSAQEGCLDSSEKNKLLKVFFHHPYVSKEYVHAELPERVPLTFYRSQYFTDEFDLELFGKPIVLADSKEKPDLIDLKILRVDCDSTSYTISVYFKAENAEVTARLFPDDSCVYRVDFLKEVEY